MAYTLLAVAIISALVMVAAITWPATRKYRRLVRMSSQPRYAKTGAFMTELEREMYANLQDMVGPGLAVFPNVRLYDILDLSSGNEERNTALASRIRSEVVDFLVCDRRSTMPMLVVEMRNLADTDEETTQRNDLVDRLLESAGLPLLPISRESPRSKLQLAEHVQGSLASYITKASQAA